MTRKYWPSQIGGIGSTLILLDDGILYLALTGEKKKQNAILKQLDAGEHPISDNHMMRVP